MGCAGLPADPVVSHHEEDTVVTTQSPQASGDRLNLLVRQIRFEGAGINSYELVDPNGAELPPFEAGAHIDIHVDQGITRQYSLCNDPAERHRYVIAVLRDENGRGGSKVFRVNKSPDSDPGGLRLARLLEP
jgi:NAD(P)H-flavin reductase